MPKSRKKADVDEDLVRKLANLLDETGLTEIEYGTKDWHLRVARGTSPSTGGTGATPAAAAAETAGAAEPAERVADHPGVVTAPMVGVIYTAPEPDEPPFVKVGDTVAEGQTLLLIEAMKVFNPITAPRAGKVVRILIGSGTPVEFGEPLLIIE
ncbi:MAG: acetyl-CoA carboxylase biotin carboxyl carrier protein subunit [Alphaproteobacteria bacterium]|jgi:acetyl-CoA carboxylase biotin carboxyl carrier protein|nr:acetyl-CoA carboxylase biotin carboxyl carrier protein [Pseudomonadota bacterium]MCZ6606749.1 acetyl-CoA carboxylase biotin carboxyl carrier protein subunit [Alphaproteobacteria bacterium]